MPEEVKNPEGKTDVEQLTGILNQFSLEVVEAAARNRGLEIAPVAFAGGATEGKINQACGANEERYWRAIRGSVNGTASVTNDGPCTMTMRVELEGADDATETVQHDQTKGVTDRRLKALHVKCASSTGGNQCVGTWRISR